VKRPIPALVTKAYESITANKLAEMRDHCRDFRTLFKEVHISDACKALSAQGATLVACRVWARLEPAPFFDTDFTERYEALNKDFSLHEWITGEPVVRKKEVPARATETYTAIARNSGMCDFLKGLTLTELKDRIAYFFGEKDSPVATLVSLRLWHKLKEVPNRAAAYWAQFKAESQVYDLDAWFTQPESSTPMPDKAKDVSIKLQNLDYADIEARMMAEPQDYQKQFLCEISDSDLDRNRVFPKELIDRLRSNRPRGSKSLLISTPTGQDSWLRSEYATKEVLFPQPPKKVITMNANKPYENISYVYGVAATTASDAHLIDSIKRVDTEINRLSDLKGTSKKVDAMVKSLEGDKAAIVAILDSRP